MNPAAQSLAKKTYGLATAWQRWRGYAGNPDALSALPSIAVPAKDIRTLESPAHYRETLLALIAQARRRILIATLYLQDDDAGREILTALHTAKQARPELDVEVYVDWHRAQRGLIGKAKSEGNAALYKAMAQRFGPGVMVFGVPVQRREFLGVMHLKGFVIDDCVLYSGASLNDVYLQRHARYRLDRYHLIHSAALADSLATMLAGHLRGDAAVHPLDTPSTPRTIELRPAIARFRQHLAHAQYAFPTTPAGTGDVTVTPLLGLGVRKNLLNTTILHLIHQARSRIVIFTPYFNLPGPIRRALHSRIKAGCHVTIILGDKTANDFYIPPEEPFKSIGALPYLYEANLRRFCKTYQKAIDTGVVEVRLWRHADNTFHLKGLLVDDDYALLTGNNLNPRAWRLDLENGLLIHDPARQLMAQHEAELARILAHTRRLQHHGEIDAFETYPAPVQRLIRRLSRVRADRLVNHML